METWDEVLNATIDALGENGAYLGAYCQRYRQTLDFVGRHVPVEARSRVAEVGAGPVLPALRRRYGVPGTTLGLLADGWEAQLRGLGIRTIQYDANIGDLPAEVQGVFDIVLHLEVIEHLNRWPVEVLQDAARLLSPQGRLVLSTVNIARLSNRMRLLLGRSPLINPFVKTHNGRNHIREYTAAEMSHLFELAGLQLLASEYWQFRVSRTGLGFVKPLCRLRPPLSSHMFFLLRRA